MKHLHIAEEDKDVNDMSAGPALADRRIPAGDDFLPREEVSKLTPEILLARVKALQPLIAERAPIAEKLRRPDDEVWSALRHSGVFYLLIPKEFGGLEADFDSMINIGLAIAEADASTAWTATFCIEHNWMLAKWPRKAQEELWNGRFPYVISPYTANPPGMAVPVDGGYRVSAHWKWGTGSMHADHVMGMVLLPQGEGEPPVPLSIIVPAEQAQIIDTWYMAGMQSTGSNDVVFNDVFIPEHFAARDIFAGTSEVSHDNPMYKVPFLPFLGLAAAIPVVGATRGMVKMYQDRVKSQLRTFATTVSMDRPQSQARLARAELTQRSAELMLRDAARRLMVFGTLPEEQKMAERLAIRAQLSLAVTICRDLIMQLVEGAGTTAHAAGSHFNRAMRDVITLSTHLVFEYDTSMEQHGRGLVGLPPNSQMI